MNAMNKRREILKKGVVLTAAATISSLGVLSACSKKEEKEEKEITPSEDLMREHGVLNRILLIYDHYLTNLKKTTSVDFSNLNKSAQIIRTFIENYHEKLEEDYLFPRFEKANQLTDLVKVLREQHKAGRYLTEQILLYENRIRGEEENQKLIKLLSDFTTMYRPHEAREDTVLFPALARLVSSNEYYSLGEDFEKAEHKLFGADGFEAIVKRVEDIEKQLGIYEIAQFTPIV
jgi:hemerythrin-like domain-containing protein